MSQVDQKRAFNKLKHDLEPWRHFIVLLNSLVTWEKQFYPAVIFAIISLFFLMLWILDMSIVSLLALGGLYAVIIDYAAIRLFSRPDWSGEQEAQFESVCTSLCDLKITLCAWYEFMFNNRERKSIMFLVVTSVVLLSLAWIGAVINNLLLMYFITLAVVLYPGIKEKNVLNNLKEKFGCAINTKIQQFREKTKKVE